MQAIILSVGSEITTGQTVDTNSAWLSRQLAAVGAHVRMHATVADEIEPIRDLLDRAAQEADVVLVSGGLGPTDDDLTRQALTAALGVQLVLHPPSVEKIRAFFERRQRTMPEANLIQAMFPAGTMPIENTCGTAPGIQARLHDADVFVLPGVPREMKVMFERSVLPWLSGRSGGAVLLTLTIQTYGAGESDIGMRIRDLMQRGRNPTVGTTAQQGVIGVRVYAYGRSRDEAQRMLAADAAEVRSRLGDLVYGENEETLASVVVRQLVEAKQSVATAESCTGGLVAKCLTDVPGSSACFRNGFVTYANDAKVRILEVPAEQIARHGAVSMPVAEAMAVQARRISGSDYALAITGIAGPTGGTVEKPVGLVCFGLASADGCDVFERRLGSDMTRDEIRERACRFALNLLRLRLMGRPLP